MPVMTVSQINRYIASVIRGDKKIQNIFIRGEISNYVHHRSGHRYFSLKDDNTSIKAVMFANLASRLKFTPQNGMAVIAIGSINVYERDGVYQINITDMQQDGAGAVSTSLEMLKKKLAAEGIFSQEHKRKIPPMPRKIGAVTSLTGAAIRDIVNILTRRYPLCELYAVNALVQGENASESICKGIAKAETAECDVIIVGRGGGSTEDLSAFNTESVVRAVYNCKVPVISAVGHEIDFTLTDLAADMRVPTPSAAAELASPTTEQLIGLVDNMSGRAEYAVMNILERYTAELDKLDKRLALQSPENRLKLMESELENLIKRAESAVIRNTERAELQLTEKIGRLESLSPLKVLSRGYSLVYKDDMLVRSSDDIVVGDTVKIVFNNGMAEAEVKKTGDLYE